MYIRVLPQRTDDPYTCMAIDKTIAESVAAGGPPTLRFYRWSGNGAVSLSKIQDMKDVNTSACSESGISCVRRFTGGRAMYHAPTDLTYALAVPSLLYTGADLKNEATIAIISFLEELGLQDVRCNYNGSVTVSGRKISGSVNHYEGGMFRPKAVLRHGSIFHGALDYALLGQIFNVSGDFFRKRTTSVETELSGTIDGVFSKLHDVFLRTLGSEVKMQLSPQQGELTEQEVLRIEKLRQYYQSEEWLSIGILGRGICSATVDLTREVAALVPVSLRSRLIGGSSN